MEDSVTGARPEGRRRVGVTLAVSALLVLAVGGGLLLWNPYLRARWLGVSLSLRYRTGQEIRQRLSVTWNGRHVIRGLPPELASRLLGRNGQEVRARLDMVTRIVARSVAADGTAVLESTPESCSLEVGTWRVALPRSPMSVQRVDAWGRVLDEPGGGGMSLEQRRKFDAFLSSLVSGHLCRGRCTVGQSWSEAVEVPVDEGTLQARITGRLEHTLEGFDSLDGAVLAAIGARQQLRGTMGPAGGSEGGGPVEAKGDFEGTTRVLVDSTDGVVRRVEGRGKARLAFRALLPAAVTGRRRAARVEGQVSGTLIYTMETVAAESVGK